MNEVFDHNDSLGTPVSLHDCVATSASLEDGTLAFVFPDGFRVLAGHPANPHNQTLRTDEAQVSFRLSNGDCANFRVFVYTNLGTDKDLRTEWDPIRFVEKINSGRYRLEFLHRYECGNELEYKCWLYFGKNRRHKECELYMDQEGALFSWNTLRKDCPW